MNWKEKAASSQTVEKDKLLVFLENGAEAFH